MIISAGYNIYLSHIEDIVSACSFVKQVCAVGIDDIAAGQNIGLYIILNDGTDESKALKEITEHCQKNLAEFSQPQKIIFTDDFPKTKMGKVNFKSLEDKINNK